MRFAAVKLLIIIVLSLMFFGLGKRLFRKSPPVVSATEICTLQSDEQAQNDFVIVDVRSKEETDISMIPGALTKSEFERTANQHQAKVVIAYCTVGVRSEDYAASLARQGWKARNYKGSILDWCGNNLPLMSDGKETNKVHTYSESYSVPENYIGVY